MKLIRSVARIEVKRAFVAANDTRGHSKGRRAKLSKEDFEKNFKKAKKRVKELSNSQLDRIIGREFTKRRDAYNQVDWYAGTVKTNEVAVWRGAGGLPPVWTRGSLSQTGKLVALAIKKKSKRLKKRVKLAIPGILAISADAVQKEKYLLPIILPADTIPGCRRGLKKFKGDIDDGCMRSIALAVSGKKVIKAYIGVKKK
ncbi:MAG TPA: hypothetical protein VMA75_03915 [Candidatus Paceibacterota bacterium]|nr:hypothetical protein [Candidatus Paceibacterota bacterium]